MNAVNRILGEAIRPPTEAEKTDPQWAYHYAKNVEYLKAFPDAKLDWAMNGLIDWTDL